MRTIALALAVVAVFAGRASALTPKDLNPEELARYEKVKANPKTAESFLATRDYVHKSAAVVANPQNKKLALALRRPPNFDESFLLAGDDDKINAAVELSLNAIAEKMWA